MGQGHRIECEEALIPLYRGVRETAVQDSQESSQEESHVFAHCVHSVSRMLRELEAIWKGYHVVSIRLGVHS